MPRACPPFDDFGHGTHVSGLIAAAANGAGMVGPALEVRITPYKVLDALGRGNYVTIGQAIRDAADAGADIINLSLESSEDSSTLRLATAYAVSQGALVIAASGNHMQPQVAYPAAYPSVLAIGATSYYDMRTYYSNRGVDLDMVAPGGLTGNSILSTWTSDAGVLCESGVREVNDGLFCEKSGTSMATGIASGVAALIMSFRPDLDADEVQEILLESAAPIAGTTNDVGRGRLDAAKAVRLALEPRLEYASDGAISSVNEGAMPFTVTLPLSNPSLAPVSVQVTATLTTTWLALVGPHEGEVSYGKPLELQLVYTPTAVAIGSYASTLRVTATVEGGGVSIYFINTSLDVQRATTGVAAQYMPWLSGGIPSGDWEQPNYTPRTTLTVDGSGSIVAELPFTMTVNERKYMDLRIYGDGFVVGSASAVPPTQPTHCLANQTWPSFAVYGWWSDLDLGPASSLSTFQPDVNHFVIEYDRFLPAGSDAEEDSVTFQIVLGRDGEIELNYRDVPQHLPESVTIGASIEDGRFYNQVACHVAGVTQIGTVPVADQSFVLHNEDLY